MSEIDNNFVRQMDDPVNITPVHLNRRSTPNVQPAKRRSRADRLKQTGSTLAFVAIGAAVGVELHNVHETNKHNDKLNAELGSMLTAANRPHGSAQSNQKRERAVLRAHGISPSSVDLFSMPKGVYTPEAIAEAIGAKHVNTVANLIDAQTQIMTEQGYQHGLSAGDVVAVPSAELTIGQDPVSGHVIPIKTAPTLAPGNSPYSNV